MTLGDLTIEGDRDAVLRRVAELKIDIDPIPDNRTAAETEWWIFQRALAFLPGVQTASRLTVAKRESPDFLLVTDGMETGVEVTECIPPAEGALLARQAKSEGPVAVSNIQAWRNPHDTKPETTKQYLSHDHLPPGAGHGEYERLLAEQVVARTRKKDETARKPGFERFEKNWLLLYDRASFAGIDRKKACEIARNDLSRAEHGHAFDRVFLLSTELFSVL